MTAIMVLLALAAMAAPFALHVMFRLAKPDYAPGDPLPWADLRRWLRQ